MLKSLHIENMAVIRRLDFEPCAGFTALTGETGAGKSIIIDSIGFLQCNRIARDIIRNGESRAFVGATFSCLNSDECAMLTALGLNPENNEITLGRTLSADGRSVCRADGAVITQALLRDAARRLISIHGQNDSRNLADTGMHIKIIDALAHNDTPLDVYKTDYDKYRELTRKLNALKKSEKEKYQLRDILSYQIKDIESHKLREGEEESLRAERTRLQSLERIKKQTDIAKKVLYDNERGITASFLAEKAAVALSKIADAVPGYGNLAARLRSCGYELDDIASELKTMSDVDEVDDPTARLDEIESRLEAITRLKRKYGASVTEILEFGANAKSRLEEIEDADGLEDKITAELSVLADSLRKQAADLSEGRKLAARRVEGEIAHTLKYLDMPKAQFTVSVKDGGELGEDGYDTVEFLFVANPGDTPKPLSRVASGGELSRVMLAIKCAVSEADGISTLIFDEIDTGISGKTSRKIGIKLKEASASSQVICVTHSAQIASLAQQHCLISKHETDGRAEANVSVLDREGRIKETARIIGGINVTDAQRQAAIDMIDGDDHNSTSG